MAFLSFSEDTVERARADRYRRQATHFEAMVTALEAGDQQGVQWIPKSVPRGRSLDWYRQKAKRLREQEALSEEIIDVFEHEAYVQLLARLSPSQRALYKAARQATLKHLQTIWEDKD